MADLDAPHEIIALLQKSEKDSYSIGERRRAYSGAIFSVDTFELTNPDGSVTNYEVVDHHGGAGAIVLQGTKMCVVRQFRPEVGRMTLEIPAGRIDPDEDPKETARRELIEECGLIAHSLEFVATSLGSLGWTNEATTIYFAKDIEQTNTDLDVGEFVSVYWLEVKDLLLATRKGLIQDNKTIISIYFAASHLGIRI